MSAGIEVRAFLDWLLGYDLLVGQSLNRTLAHFIPNLLKTLVHPVAAPVRVLADCIGRGGIGGLASDLDARLRLLSDEPRRRTRVKVLARRRDGRA